MHSTSASITVHIDAMLRQSRTIVPPRQLSRLARLTLASNLVCRACQKRPVRKGLLSAGGNDMLPCDVAHLSCVCEVSPPVRPSRVADLRTYDSAHMPVLLPWQTSTAPRAKTTHQDSWRAPTNSEQTHRNCLHARASMAEYHLGACGMLHAR